MFGSVAMGWANELERAIEWGERAVRLSPFNRQIYAAHIGLAVGYFAQGNYEKAVNAGRRAVRSNPAFSVPHHVLTASLAAAGRAAEAKVAAAHVLELSPNFVVAKAYGPEGSAGLPAALAKPFTEALYAAGLL
jgi:adenylate cyclase